MSGRRPPEEHTRRVGYSPICVKRGETLAETLRARHPSPLTARLADALRNILNAADDVGVNHFAKRARAAMPTDVQIMRTMTERGRVALAEYDATEKGGSK